MKKLLLAGVMLVSPAYAQDQPQFPDRFIGNWCPINFGDAWNNALSRGEDPTDCDDGGGGAYPGSQIEKDKYTIDWTFDYECKLEKIEQLGPNRYQTTALCKSGREGRDNTHETQIFELKDGQLYIWDVDQS